MNTKGSSSQDGGKYFAIMSLRRSFLNFYYAPYLVNVKMAMNS